jgi:hypothetical protein
MLTRKDKPVETWHSVGFEAINGIRTVFLDVAQELRLLQYNAVYSVENQPRISEERNSIIRFEGKATRNQYEAGNKQSTVTD